MRKWKTLESKTLFKNQWFDIKEENVQITPELAIEGVIIHKFSDWVNIIPLTSNQDVILLHRYRHGMESITTETPSGSVETADASPQDAAERELMEETGYAAEQMIHIGTSQANPQLMNNHIHHFLALNCHLVSQPTAEFGGNLEFWLEPFSRVLSRIREGSIQHSYVIEGLLRADDWLRNNKV